jgi:hypothetical protein
MKAITLWQPWASLIAVGAKKVETRSWPTSYRGRIAIHAATRSINSVIKELFPLWQWSYAPDYQEKIQFEQAVNAALKESSLSLYKLPTGVIVATADLIGCQEIYESTYLKQTKQELMFGNWTPGRYAWQLANICQVEDPIPAKGKQGLWEWTTAQEYLINYPEAAL